MQPIRDPNATEQGSTHLPSAAELLSPEQRKRALSGTRLQTVLSAFVTALLVALGCMVLLLISNIFDRLTPSIQRDLEWKAERTAVELSQTAELGILLSDTEAIQQAYAAIIRDPDIEAIVVANASGEILVSYGRPPLKTSKMFESPQKSVRRTTESLVSWAEAAVEGTAVGRVAVSVSTSRLEEGNRLRHRLLVTDAVGTLLGILLCALFVRGYIRPLVKLTEKAFLDLEDAAVQLAAKQRLEQELELGARIQTCILPSQVEVQGLEVAATMRPATEVGGDYFDILPAEGGCWIGIGDVAGHGLTSGLVMLMAQSAIAALVSGGTEQTPSSVVSRLNHVIYENVRNRLHHDEHLTLALLRYWENGRVVFSGAHEYIIVGRAQSGQSELIPTSGAWLGVIPDISSISEDSTLNLEPGDVVVLYTDGITEAMSETREMFGVHRLRAVIEAHLNETPDQLRSTILAEIERWRPTQLDDESLLVIRYVGSNVRGKWQTVAQTTGDKLMVKRIEDQLNMHRYYNTTMQPAWHTVRELRKRVAEALVDCSAELRAAAVMTASELAENAIKYGESTESAPEINFSLYADDGEICIECANACTNVAGVTELMERVREIALSADASVLYIQRLEQLMTNPTDSAKLGLYRVALEGGFGLECTYENDVVRVKARRKIQ